VNYPLKPSRTVYSDPDHPAAMRHRRSSTEPQSQSAQQIDRPACSCAISSPRCRPGLAQPRFTSP
jgi:hypothetical protein